MRKIVIANQKGGVAKTTTAVNLATGLAMKGKKTLLIDMDPQANATFAVLGAEDFEYSTYDLLIRDVAMKDVVQKTERENLDIIPSHIDLAGAEVELISKIGGQTSLRTKVSELDEEPPYYDYIIIDAPPSLGFLTINALAAAEEVFIPVSTSVFALNGISRLEDTVRRVRRDLHCPSLRIAGVLCTMFDNTNVAKDVVSETQKHFSGVIFKTVIPKNVKLEEAHSRSESIFTYAQDSKGSEAYMNFVEEVISYER